MNTLKFFIKLTITILLYTLIFSLIYSIYIIKSSNNINILTTLILSSVWFLILGFCYANHFRKKGLFIGFLVSIIHFLLIKLILYLSTNEFDTNYLKICIITITGGIGGFIGGNIKKIF